MVLPSTSGMHPGGVPFYRAPSSFPPSSSSATVISSSSFGDLKKEPSPHPLDPRLQRRRVVTLPGRQPSAKSFPPEILRAIFRFARRAQSTYDVNLPVCVSHVSRTWRRVALEDPTLWNSLVIKPYHSAEFVNSYLPRSQGYPMHIRFAYRGKDWPMYFLEIMEFLTSHAQRWRELQIELQDVRLLHPVLGSFSTLSVPNLEGFSLSLENEGRDPPSYGIPMFLGGAPKLVQVYFSNVDPSRVYLGRAPVQLLQISTDQAVVRPNALKSMCDTRETLTTLVLHRLDLSEHAGQFMVFLPNLEQLVIDGMCTAHFDIMKYLGAPNLRRLVILGGKNSSVFEEWLTKEVKTNRVNLFQSVETLEFWGMAEYVYLGMSHMLLFPSVAHVKVLQGEFRPLLRRLRDSVWRKVRIWPRLRTLTLEHATDPAPERPNPGSLSCLRTDEEDQFEIICNVISARKHIDSPLRKLRLSSDLVNGFKNRPHWLEYLERNQVELLDVGYSTVEFAKSRRFEESGGL